jgi:NADH-quinone oxidoreductase subunit J
MASVLGEPVVFSDIPLLFFVVVAAFMVISALGTVMFRNPLYGVICLVGNLLGVAAMFAALGAYFLSTVQVAVYAGAITVLFLFVVMLLNLKSEDGGESLAIFKIAAIGVGVSFVCIMMYAYIPDLINLPGIGGAEGVMSQIDGGVLPMGRALFTRHVFLFEAISAVLMVALIASVMLASRGAKKDKLEHQVPISKVRSQPSLADMPTAKAP